MNELEGYRYVMRSDGGGERYDVMCRCFNAGSTLSSCRPRTIPTDEKTVEYTNTGSLLYLILACENI